MLGFVVNFLWKEFTVGLWNNCVSARTRRGKKSSQHDLPYHVFNDVIRFLTLGPLFLIAYRRRSPAAMI